MKPGYFEKLVYLMVTGVLLLLQDVCAQSPAFNTIAGKDQFNGGNVSRTLQDEKGFIWIGTNKGLFVYDGFGFSEATFFDSLQTPDVTSLNLDKLGRVWVGFSDGKIAHGHETGFSFFAPDEGLPKVPVTDILFEPDSTLWISTYGEGVFYFKNNRLFNIDTDDGLGDNYVYTLTRNSDGTIWAGNDAGISVCSSVGNKKILRHYSTSDGLPDIIVQTIVSARSGGLWIGMQEKGICYYNTTRKTFEFPFSEPWNYGSVNDILDFGDLLWIATEGNGLIEISRKSGKSKAVFRHIEPTGKRVSRLLYDREGSVWLASSGSLLWSSGPGIRHYKNAGDLRLGNIHTLHAEEDESFWFGNDKGFFYYDPERSKETALIHLLPPQSKGGQGITSIHHDTRGNMWIGTFGNGLFRIAYGTLTATRIMDAGGVLNDNILGISGNGNDMWFATLGGAATCGMSPGADGKFRFRHFLSESGLGNNFIYTVLADRKGRIWFGTDGKGPAMYGNGKFTRFGPEQGMLSKVIYSVTQDDDGNIWFSSSNEGIYRYDGKQFTNFSLKSGLRDIKITSVINAQQNQVVVVHTQGLDVINTRTGQISYLGMQSGVADINPDLNAVAADSSGSVWIGTRDGIIRYKPEYLNAMVMPMTSVRRVSVYLSDKAAKPGEVFAHDRNHISFDYIGIWFNNPQKVTYRVKLEGNDPDWIYTGNRITTYSNLQPGNYTFRVQSSVNNDFTYAREATFGFSISSPFYIRWWFVLTVGILVLAIVYFIIRSRLSRIRREQQLLKEKAESQFQVLRSQVNPHFLFNNFSTLMAIIEEDKDLAIEYVGKLSAFFRNILEYRDKELIPISEELEIAENYLFLQKKRYGDNISVQKDIKNEHLHSYIPPLTLQLLLENAVKHNIVSVAKPLSIHIYSTPEFLIIENALQPRKTSEPSTGMGLQNIRSRYRIFTNKEINILQTETLFRISLPLIFSKTKKS